MDIHELSNRLTEAGVANTYGICDECEYLDLHGVSEVRPEHVLRGDDLFIRHLDANAHPGCFTSAEFLFGMDSFEIEVYPDGFVCLYKHAFQPEHDDCPAKQVRVLGVSQSWEAASYDPAFSVLEAC